MAGLLDVIKEKAKQQYQQGLLNQILTNPASIGTELSQLFDPQYMSQVNPMSQESAMDVALSAPMMAGTIGYRGLTKPYDASVKNNIEWFSETPELANVYSGSNIGSNIIKKELGDVNKNAVDLGFRDYKTEVKLDDVLDRVEKRVIDAFNNKKIDKATGLNNLDELEKLRNESSEFKQVHQWLSGQDKISEILKKSGYDALSHIENGYQTYGILK